MKRLQIASVLTTVLFVVPFICLAEETGFYAGFGGGRSEVDDIGKIGASELLEPGDVLNSFSNRVDDEDIGWKIFGGYKVNEFFSVEVAHIDLGEANTQASASIIRDGLPIDASVSVDVETDGLLLSVITHIPFSESLSFFGKVGAFNWDTDINAEATSSALGSSTTTSLSADDSGTDLALGLGAKYYFNNTVAGCIEWERFRDIEAGGDSDIELLSVGLHFLF